MKKITVFLYAAILLLTAVVFMLGISATEPVRYYVNSSSGLDTNTGLSADRPLKRFTTACALAKRHAAQEAYIVFTDEYHFSSSVQELQHPDMKLILTSNDGNTDYGKKGAKLVFGDTLRYYLNGDTTFENIAIEYTNSVNFVAQYNHITFGDGVTHTALDAYPAGIYVVGGWQSPKDDAVDNLDSHITIKSGEYAVVVGGSRQKASGHNGKAYSGTHHIDISGGTVEMLYGGSLEQQISNNLVLTVSGGRIEYLHAAGDKTRRLDGTAEITLSGGSVGTAFVRNVIRDITVTACGTKIGNMYVLYWTDSLNQRQFLSNRPKTLYYDSRYYTEEEIDAFEGFTAKVDMNDNSEIVVAGDGIMGTEDENVFFLCDGGTGSGKSFSDASSSLADAYRALGKSGGTVVICGPFTYRRPSKSYTKNMAPIIFTSAYLDVDYAELNDAEMRFFTHFYCLGETDFRDITLRSELKDLCIYAEGHKLHFGDNITCEKEMGLAEYLTVVGGSSSSLSDTSTELIFDSGTWNNIYGGSGADAKNVKVSLTVNGGTFNKVILASSGSHTGDITANINGGTVYQGIFGASYSNPIIQLNSNISLNINGGSIYADIAPLDRNCGIALGSFNVRINGGDLAHLTELVGSEGLSGTMTSTLSIIDSIDITADVTGDMSFTNPIRLNGADPWLFFHDGNYYYTATTGHSLGLARAANIGDLKYAEYKTIYTPEKGKDWSYHVWSPEIHYYTDEQAGEGNGGWYCYIASSALSETADVRMFVLKCLDGDDLFGRWGHPVTGEVNVPARVVAPEIPNYDEIWMGGQSDILINGKMYSIFVADSKHLVAKGEETERYQYIVITEFENPWTIKGTPVMICRPEYDWEKVGSKNGGMQVVEGSTAVYGKDGSVYIVYTGSGYWTNDYQLGLLEYIGGDPLDADNWKKHPKSIFSKNEEITGNGHASYVTDTEGQGWICYHAYIGTYTDDFVSLYGNGRRAFVEPYYADENGVVIGNGSGTPAPLDTVYSVKLNPMPLADKISGFTKQETFSSELRMTVDSMTAYVNGAATTLDAAPVIKNSLTMLPIRFVAESLGATVDWDSAARAVIVKNDSVSVEIVIGDSFAKVNGERIALSSPAYIEPSNNRTYLPVRVVAESLGAAVSWDGVTRTAILVK